MCYYLGPGRSKKIQIRYHVGMNSLTTGAMLNATSSCYFLSLMLAITNDLVCPIILICHTMFFFHYPLSDRYPLLKVVAQLQTRVFFTFVVQSHCQPSTGEDLARFGYRTGRMVIVFRNPAAVLQPAGASTLNLSNPKQLHKSIQKHCFSGVFSKKFKKTFEGVRAVSFFLTFWRNFTQKKMLL